MSGASASAEIDGSDSEARKGVAELKVKLELLKKIELCSKSDVPKTHNLLQRADEFLASGEGADEDEELRDELRAWCLQRVKEIAGDGREAFDGATADLRAWASALLREMRAMGYDTDQTPEYAALQNAIEEAEERPAPSQARTVESNPASLRIPTHHSFARFAYQAEVGEAEYLDYWNLYVPYDAAITAVYGEGKPVACYKETWERARKEERARATRRPSPQPVDAAEAKQAAEQIKAAREALLPQ